MPLQEPVRGYGFSNIFPNLFFSRPVGIAIPPGETNRLFVVEQTGRVMLVQNSALSVFLDLRDSVWVTRESGLLSMAFHPNFAANGRFFTCRILATPEHRFRFRLSEFRCDPAASSADPQTEKILISDFVMDEEHNAGDLSFGPDGFLYLSIGEEISGSPETLARPQRIDQGFFGGILRIDVDGREDSLRPNPYNSATGDYWIPKDNPFVGAQSFLGQSLSPGAVRTEFYAVGLRNPWRMNFDPLTGRLICADVGSAFFEEINIVERGGNYGWPYQEGPQAHEPAPAGAAFLSAAHAYPRESGSCIIGGLIYRGAEFPELSGKYLFADFVSGSVWARDLDDPASPSQWLGARSGFSTFAYAPDGGVLLANHTDGSICRLVRGHSVLPERLSETGAFRDLASLAPVESALPFEVNSPLWSDGANKKRWVDFSRADGPIQVLPDGRWRYPAGAVWIKHFELELTNGVPESRRRLETRLLVKTERDVYCVTYRWQGADALLVPPQGLDEILLVNDRGTVRPQVWRYPAAEECRTCHNRDASYILGFNAGQLNRTNQIEFFASRNFFDSRLDPHQLPQLAGLNDPRAPLQQKARSYLESNCAQCHQPGARALTDWDARHSVPLHAAQLAGASPVFFPPPMKIVDAGRPLNSLLLNKASTRTPGFGMPPLASSLVDRQFTNVLAQWIATLPQAGWVVTNVGRAVMEGSAEQHGDTMRLFSAGGGFSAGSFLFAGRKVSAQFELIAPVPQVESESALAEGGLAALSGTHAAAIFVKGSQIVLASSSTGSMASHPRMDWQWLKLARTGAVLSAWIATENLRWTNLGEISLPSAEPRLAGFMAACGGTGVRFAAVSFSQHMLTGEIAEPPEPAELPPELPRHPASARFLGIDTNTLGSWRSRYGRDGYWLVGDERRLPEWFALVARDAEASSFVDETFLPQALQRPESDGRFASALYGRPGFSIQMAPTDARPAVVGLYLLDFNYRRRVLDIAVETLEGTPLDRQVASDFSRGLYLFWEIEGPVTFRFAPQSFAAGVSGIFVDRQLTSLDLDWNNATPASPEEPRDAALLADSDRDGISNGIEFHLGFDPFDRGDRPKVHCSIVGNELALAFEDRKRGPGVSIQFDASEDLAAWRSIAPERSQNPGQLVVRFPRRENRSFVRFRPARE